jgi:AAA ATPase domain
VPRSERVPTVSTQISSIIMKLLAKTAEHRYQTAACVLSGDDSVEGRRGDLRLSAIQPFRDHEPVGGIMRAERERVDTTLPLPIRQAALKIGGMSELVLVSGYSGIGNSSLVNELHKALVPPRGLIVAGKFDRCKRNIPYATLAQACPSLVHRILKMSDAEMRQWRTALLEALGPNGQLMIDPIPKLETRHCALALGAHDR